MESVKSLLFFFGGSSDTRTDTLHWVSLNISPTTETKVSPSRGTPRPKSALYLVSESIHRRPETSRRDFSGPWMKETRTPYTFTPQPPLTRKRQSCPWGSRDLSRGPGGPSRISRSPTFDSVRPVMCDRLKFFLEVVQVSSMDSLIRTASWQVLSTPVTFWE